MKSQFVQMIHGFPGATPEMEMRKITEPLASSTKELNRARKVLAQHALQRALSTSLKTVAPPQTYN